MFRARPASSKAAFAQEGHRTMKRTLSVIRHTSVLALLMWCCAASAQAQFRAGVQGTVTDPAGAVVPEASVTLTNTETNRSQQTTSSDEGFYSFSNLAPGRYTLSAEKGGFKKT